MSQHPSESSGSNTGLVIVVALAVLALPCCGGLLLFLGGFAFVSLESRPPQPAVMLDEAWGEAFEAVSPEDGTSEEGTTKVHIEVDPRGNVVLDGEPVTWEELESKLKARRREDAALEVVVAARNGEAEATARLLRLLAEGQYLFSHGNE